MVKKDFNYFFLKGNKYFFRSCKEMETFFIIMQKIMWKN